MARRSGQLYEILGARAGKPAPRRSVGRKAAAQAAGRSPGLDQALGVGRSFLGWVERMRPGGGGAAARGAGRTAAAQQPVAPAGAGGAALLIAALIALLVGFGLGRWTGGSAAAAAGDGDLRRSASAAEQGRTPDWLKDDPEAEREGSDRSGPLTPAEELQPPAGFGDSLFFVPVVGYRASQLDQARRIASWLRSEGFETARVWRSPKGEHWVVLYTQSAARPSWLDGLRGLSPPADVPYLAEYLHKVSDPEFEPLGPMPGD